MNPRLYPGPGDLDLGPEWCQGGACPHDHPVQCSGCIGSGWIYTDTPELGPAVMECPFCDGYGEVLL